MAGERRNDRGRIGLLKGSIALPLALLTAVFAVIPSGDAPAQERPRTVMEMLFGNSSRQAAPPRRVERRSREARERRSTSSRRQEARERRTQTRRQQASGGRRSTTRQAAAPAPAVIEKSEDARTVLVVGDFLAGSLAKGLVRTFESDPTIAVVEKSSGSSGLVRLDHYDWLAELKPLIEKNDPAALVVMLGSNDRQPLTLGSKSLPLRSEEWTAAYETRVSAMTAIAKDAGVPLVWVGMPSFKFDRMSEDMVFLNDLYRTNAANVSGEFVDVWDGFVDANGAFSYSGPDVAGQPAQLRNSDGITMTPAGEDKLAFFARRPLEKFLGQTAVASAEPGADAAAGGPQGPMPPDGFVPPAAPIDLGAPLPDGSDDLLAAEPPTLTASAEPSPRAPASQPQPQGGDLAVVATTPPPATEGRADDFQWNEKGSAVATPGGVAAAQPITASGSVELAPLRDSSGLTPPPEMPSLEDAIIEEWQRESDAARGDAPPVAPPAPAQ